MPIHPASPPTTTKTKKKKGPGYVRVGGPSPETCRYHDTEDEIVRLLKERSGARRARDFAKADAILRTLQSGGVAVDDTQKQWRVDGQSFWSSDGSGSSDDSDDECQYERINDSSTNNDLVPSEEDVAIRKKLAARVRAKKHRDFDMADDLRDELRFYHDVEVDDEKRVYWKSSTAALSSAGYTFGGKRLTNVSDQEYETICDLVRERESRRRERSFERADGILARLARDHGVRVDDRRKLWHFDQTRVIIAGVSVGVGVSRENPNNTNKNKNKTTPPKPLEISIVTRHEQSELSSTSTIPDGITISDQDDDDVVPEGISIPDGISLPEDNDDYGSTSTTTTMDEDTLRALTVPDLKTKLQQVGLPVSGRKEELIQRLIQSSNNTSTL